MRAWRRGRVHGHHDEAARPSRRVGLGFREQSSAPEPEGDAAGQRDRRRPPCGLKRAFSRSRRQPSRDRTGAQSRSRPPCDLALHELQTASSVRRQRPLARGRSQRPGASRNSSPHNVDRQLDGAERDDRGGEVVERDEAALALFVSNPWLSEAVEPTVADLDDPAPRLLRRVAPLRHGLCAASHDVRAVAMTLDHLQRMPAALAVVGAQVLSGETWLEPRRGGVG